MSDLDFEELDQAINDLYESLDDDRPAAAKASQPLAQSATPSKMTRLRHSTKVTVDDNSARGQEQAASQSIARPAATAHNIDVAAADQVAKQEASQPGKGHFMDMIHPSSDAMVQHKHNFAAERQSQIIEAAVNKPDDSASASASKATSRIAIVDEDAVDIISSGPSRPSKSIRSTKPARIAQTVPIVTTAGSSAGVAAAAKATPKAGLVTIAAKSRPPLASRRLAQVSNANRKSRRDLAQPLPSATAGTALQEPTAKDGHYEVPFLPDAKVAKRPLGGQRQPSVVHTARTCNNSDPNNNERPERRQSVDRVPANNRLDSGRQTSGVTSNGRQLHQNDSVPTTGRDRRRDNYAASSDRPELSPSPRQRGNGLRFLLWAAAFAGIVIAGIALGLLFYYYL